MAKHLDTEIMIEEHSFPLRVHVEQRASVRIAVGKKHINLRLPRGLTTSQIDGYMDWAEKWIHKQYHSDDLLKTRFLPKQYKSGDTLELLGRTYTIYISYEDRKSHGGKIDGYNIFLKLSNNDKELNTSRAIKQLLSRMVSHSFLPFIKKRVFALNDLYFQKPITGVRLKYNSSNWGSCSSKGNVNLSSRLLFAPQEVIDYVIIHELAHLIEMNHSAKFWSIVARAMPNYKDKEKWLRVHGSKCDF
ncbi:M48 family metallopeptidase [Saprospiraceae bacterium]|nr:M48 family metallopeptidase [Saprospiraceae bacterium]